MRRLKTESWYLCIVCIRLNTDVTIPIQNTRGLITALFQTPVKRLTTEVFKNKPSAGIITLCNRAAMRPSWEPIERGLEIQEAWKLENLEVWTLGGQEH